VVHSSLLAAAAGHPGRKIEQESAAKKPSIEIFAEKFFDIRS
jgi:hypothetical protein